MKSRESRAVPTIAFARLRRRFVRQTESFLNRRLASLAPRRPRRSAVPRQPS